MFHRNLQCVIFSAIIMGSGLLLAQPPGRGGPPAEMILQLFQLADANRDGSVTRAELTTAMQNLAQGDRRGPGGPPPQQVNQADQPRPGNAEQGHHGPPPQPGQVLPEPIAASLNLNDRQTRQLAALQADVDKRLAAILTDEQKEQLQNARPSHGPGHVEGEQGERPDGLPQRPQRPE
jgi:hypothetical protein